MNILICSIMPAGSYSGGRYHAWMMAHAFAALGHRVTFWTNNAPIFVDDFKDFESGDLLDLELTRNFSEMPKGEWDFVWIIPHKHPPVKVFWRAMEIAAASKAKLGMLSFETPNWIAKTAEHGADPKPWAAWKLIGPHLDVILASTQIGMVHAVEYFAGADARFHHITPPVNNLAADEAKLLVNETGGRRSIICITRFGGSFGYKGGMELLEHAGPALSGCRLTFIVGTATMDVADKEAYEAWGQEHDVEVFFQHRVTDVEKFKLLHEADLMLFLSRFEGFGYPPVEALYCDTPCIVYDLPVLREVSGEKLIYAPMDKPEALGPIIRDVLDSLEDRKAQVRGFDHSSLGFGAYVKQIEEMLAGEAGHVAKADTLSESALKATRCALVAIDESQAKTAAAPGKPTLRYRIQQKIVRVLASTFHRVPALRNVFGQALLSRHNLSRLLEDRAMEKLLFENRKALTLAIRQNPSFLKHLMLSQQGQELLPEVMELLEIDVPVKSSDVPSALETEKKVD